MAYEIAVELQAGRGLGEVEIAGTIHDAGVESNNDGDAHIDADADRLIC